MSTEFKSPSPAPTALGRRRSRICSASPRPASRSKRIMRAGLRRRIGHDRDRGRRLLRHDDSDHHADVHRMTKPCDLCPIGVQCARHNIVKHAHLRMLCETREDYRAAVGQASGPIDGRPIDSPRRRSPDASPISRKPRSATRRAGCRRPIKRRSTPGSKSAKRARYSTARFVVTPNAAARSAAKGRFSTNWHGPIKRARSENGRQSHAARIGPTALTGMCSNVY